MGKLEIELNKLRLQIQTLKTEIDNLQKVAAIQQHAGKTIVNAVRHLEAMVLLLAKVTVQVHPINTTQRATIQKFVDSYAPQYNPRASMFGDPKP
jgi:hypothetical protein